jgi:hypothetical protein
MYRTLDSETLQVSGLGESNYSLKIDGRPIGTFSRAQLAQGINLAMFDTPMMQQADKVLELVWHRVDIRFFGWRGIQVALRNDQTRGLQQAVSNVVDVLNREQDDLIVKARVAAQPQAHRYKLTPVR